RRLPGELQDAAPDGAAEGCALDAPGSRQAAPGDRRQREGHGPRRGDRALDDATGAPPAAPNRRLTAQADRGGQRDLRPAGQPAALGAQADAEDDEADEERQNAWTPTGAPATSSATTKEIDGRTNAIDPCRVEEEPGLPGGRG